MTFFGVLVILFRLDARLAALTAVVVFPVGFLVNRFENRYRVVARNIQDQQGDLGLITLSALVPIAVLARWFERSSQRAYRAVRESVALVIVQYVESVRGIRAVQAIRREPRTSSSSKT